MSKSLSEKEALEIINTMLDSADLNSATLERSLDSYGGFWWKLHEIRPKRIKFLWWWIKVDKRIDVPWLTGATNDTLENLVYKAEEKIDKEILPRLKEQRLKADKLRARHASRVLYNELQK